MKCNETTKKISEYTINTEDTKGKAHSLDIKVFYNGTDGEIFCKVSEYATIYLCELESMVEIFKKELQTTQKIKK